ncbi:DUF397 domain-containing protein [Streptomyces milbemycinicus]|uniref:DUF397 domain-containing protein n=1 Tax=Streptomyces milbemycinicus TaxID=476552 RepID=A0ABW8LTG6_9ACTN
MEVANGISGVVPVRDSKNPQGPALLFPTTSWAVFITRLKTGYRL